MSKAARWTEEEILSLKELAKEYCISDVADKLHRPQTSVRVKGKQLGILFAQSSNAWTQQDEEFLRNNWNVLSGREIAKEIRKSASGVYSKAKLFGLPEADYTVPSKVVTKIRICFACKAPNDRPAPATKCSDCFVGPRPNKGTGWASRRCLNCNSGYTGKTRDYCTRDCKSEAATKVRMSHLANPQQEKECKKCGTLYPIYKFNLDSTRKDKVHPYCRDCQKAGKVSASVSARNRRLLKTYGITQEEYDSLLASQDGHCAMCPSVCTSERTLAVDHDHNTGAVRGLLCLTCNKYKLGQLTLEDVDRIYNYLHNPPADNHFGLTRFVPVGMEKPKKRRKKRKTREQRI